MSQNRRSFMKEAALISAASYAVPASVHTAMADECGEISEARCPYFDQPLTCGGPDENGVYRCDT